MVVGLLFSIVDAFAVAVIAALAVFQKSGTFLNRDRILIPHRT